MNKHFDKDWLLSLIDIDGDPEVEGALDDTLTGDNWEDGLTEEHLFVFTDPESSQPYACHYYAGSYHYRCNCGDDSGDPCFDHPGRPYDSSETLECWPMESYEVTTTKYRKVR
jgi:hypothetical protein